MIPTCEKCGTTDCDNCREKTKRKAKYNMHLNDGTDIAELSYKPDMGDVIKIDETDKWYKVTHINSHQKWCTCRELANPIF